MRLLPLACILLVAVTGHAKKPPLTVNAPEVARRYWEVQLRIDRGKLRIERAVRRTAREGKRILRMAGPFQLRLMGAGKEIDRYDFSFPLLGPGEYDRKLAAGLSARTRVLVAHRRGLRGFVAEGPGGAPPARWRIRRRSR